MVLHLEYWKFEQRRKGKKSCIFLVWQERSATQESIIKVRLIEQLGFCFSDMLLAVIMHYEKHGLTKFRLTRT